MLRLLIGPDEGYRTAVQLSFRAVILLVFGILCARISLRRTFAQASPLDLIVALIVGSNLSRMMIGNSPFWPSVAATLVLVVTHRALAMATLRWGPLAKFMKGKPIVLVRDGVTQDQDLFHQGISRDDLLESLRMERVETIGETHLAVLEAGGTISVLSRSKA